MARFKPHYGPFRPTTALLYVVGKEEKISQGTVEDLYSVEEVLGLLHIPLGLFSTRKRVSSLLPSFPHGLYLTLLAQLKITTALSALGICLMLVTIC